MLYDVSLYEGRGQEQEQQELSQKLLVFVIFVGLRLLEERREEEEGKEGKEGQGGVFVCWTESKFSFAPFTSSPNSPCII